MKGATGRVGGFSLIEVMIVIAIAAAAVTLGVSWLNAERARALRAAEADDTAKEISTIARALDVYLSSSSGLPEPEPFDVTSQQLIDAGLLPFNYAIRNGEEVPRTSTGMAYTMRAFKKDGKYRGAVVVNDLPPSEPVASQTFRRIGLEYSPQGEKDFLALVMRRATSKFMVTAAVVDPGWDATTLSSSGFNVEVNQLMQNVGGSPRHVLVALVGYTELSANPDIKVSVDPASFPAGGGGGLNLEGRTCGMTSNACRANEEEVWSMGACDGAANFDVSTDTVGTKILKLGGEVWQINGFADIDRTPIVGSWSIPQYDTASYGSGIWSVSAAWFSAASSGISSAPNGAGVILDSHAVLPARGGGNYPWNWSTPSDPVAHTIERWEGTQVLMGSAPGTTFSKLRTLDSCGTRGEAPTDVYRVESGGISYSISDSSHYLPKINLMANPDWPWGAGAQFLSAVNPSIAKRPVAAAATGIMLSRIGPTAGGRYMKMCSLRFLGSQNDVSSRVGNISKMTIGGTNYGSPSNAAEIEASFGGACPASSGRLTRFLSGSAAVTVGYPIRTYRYDYSGGERYRYCCTR